MTESIRVFVVEDHDVARLGIRSAIEAAEDIVILGMADEEPAAIEMIRERHPDVVLVDLNLRFGRGVRVIREVLNTDPDIRFLALTVSAAAEDVVSVIRAGALGYLTKDVLATELVDKIRLVHAGNAVVSQQLAAFALEAFQGEAPSTDDVDTLTSREREVATLIARGYTNRQVGAELDISIKTVEKHVGHLLQKLSLTNRSQVTRWVMEHPSLG